MRWWDLGGIVVITLVLSASVGTPLLLGMAWLAPLNLLELGLLVISGGLAYVTTAALLWRVFNTGPLKNFEALKNAKTAR